MEQTPIGVVTISDRASAGVYEDKGGPGTRVPALLISPFAKRGFVDHTVMDTTAIAKLIETRFGLLPLGSRDAASPDMTEAFDFGP